MTTNAARAERPATGAEDGYRFEHFTIPLVLRDMRFSRGSLAPGEVVPNHTLIRSDGAQTDLRTLAADRPLVLITGSVSCPMTDSSLPRLVELEREHGAHLRFALLYTREAHPGENYGQSRTHEEKLQHARDFQQLHGVSWPVLVDDLDGTVHRLLDAKPNSVHVLSDDGTILFRALFASDSELDAALRAIAAAQTPRRSQGTEFVGPTLVSGGYIQRVLARAGRRATLDVWKSAPPMALLGAIANLFPWVRRTKRGAAVVAAFGVLAAVAAGLSLLW